MQAGDARPTFDDFSKAFDEVLQARRTLEAIGDKARAAIPPVSTRAAQRAYDDAVKRYDYIVAALINGR